MRSEPIKSHEKDKVEAEAQRIAEGVRRAELDSEEREAGLGESGVYEVSGLVEEDAKRAGEAARKARESRESQGRS